MRWFLTLLFAVGALCVLAEGFVVAGASRTSVKSNSSLNKLNAAVTDRERSQGCCDENGEPVTIGDDSSDPLNLTRPVRTCCPNTLYEIFGYRICGPELCNPRWGPSTNETAIIDAELAPVNHEHNSTIEKRKEDALCCFTSGLLVFDCHFCSTASSTSQDIGQDEAHIVTEDNSVEKRKEDALCCFTSGLLVFGCHFCYAMSPGIPQVSHLNTTQADMHNETKSGITNILDKRQKKSSSEPCCVKGPTAVPIYDCNQCRNGPQDSPSKSNKVFKRYSKPEVCCWDLTMADPTCWTCSDKPFDASATIWAPIEVLNKEDTVKYVKVWSPINAPSTEIRDKQGLCCWLGTTTISSCWACDRIRTPGVEMWVSQNEKPWTPDSTEDFRFQIIRPSSTNTSVEKISVDRCCVVNIVWICFDCASAALAPEIPSLPHNTATMTHGKRESKYEELQTRYLVEQCCYTTGLVIYGCHTCGDFRPVSNLGSGAWELEEILQNGHSVYRESPNRFDPGFSGSVEGPHPLLFCISDDPATMLCEPYVPAATMTAPIEQLTDLTEWGTPTATKVFPRQQTYNFHVVCGGNFDQYKHKCSKGKSTISGGTCLSSCICTDLGGMKCKGPAGTECSDQETTNYCLHGGASWACSCSHRKSAAVTEWPNIYPTGLGHS